MFIDKLTYSQPLTTTFTSAPLGSSNSYRTRFFASLATYTAPSPTNLTVWGTRGWYRALPVHDVSGLARFAGEMKDIPDMVKGTFNFFSQFRERFWRNRSAKFWADAYLNHQFGWAPFVQDLFGFLSLGSRVDQALNQLIKRNGQPIHRRFTMLNEDYYQNLGSTSLLSGGIVPVLDGHSYAGTSDKTVYTDRLHVKRRIYFEGKFRYYFTPEELRNPDFRNYLRLQLAGVIPDMNTVYQLVPWTWFYDWFVNTGDIVKNLSAMSKYRQVALYAYVMCSESYTARRLASTVVKTGPFPSSSNSQIICISEKTQEYITRVAASPYGFGLSWSGFSPYQLSILAALGMSRT